MVTADRVAAVLAVVQSVGMVAALVGAAVLAVAEFAAGWREAGERYNDNDDNGGETCQ